MKQSISVVIPNFNGRSLLEKNLPSVVLALKNTGAPHEVIVSDDASTDDSVSFITTFYPNIVLITHNNNSGFSTNINSGLKKAQYDLVLALNNDVSLAPDYFQHLLSHFQTRNIFGVMGALLDPETQIITDGAKLAEQTLFGSVRSTKNILRNDGLPLVTLFLSGANALIDRKKLTEIGYFDAVFDPFYNEDVELSLRAWRMGWKCVFEQKAVAYHASSSTIQNVSNRSRIRVISIRNRLFLHDIHLEGTSRLLFFGKLIFDLLFRWLSLDLSYYKAFFLYLGSQDKLKKSKMNLRSLKPSRSLDCIVDEVRKEQIKTPHRIFS